MKNILVTGGCGFIGANFIRYVLEDLNFDGRIINLDKLTYAGNPDNLSDLGETFGDRYILEKRDICDRNAVNQVFAKYDVEGICHFAAESHVDRSIAQPDEFIQTNINGTFNLLEAARHSDKVRLFHHVSTDEVFGSLGAAGFFTETTAYKPNSPYSASKAASDHLVRAYHKTYGLPVTISNCSNNYGPYQFPEKLIPLMIINARDYKLLPVYGDGRNVRDWLYVKDHCEAIWTVMQNGQRGQTYNVGGDNEMANIDVVGLICDILDEILPDTSQGPRRQLISFVKDRPGHDQRYAIDFTKIRTGLDWRPRESFQTGLRKTIAWYLGHQKWIDRVQSGEYQKWIARNYTRR